MDEQDQQKIWDAEVAGQYDTPGAGSFAAEVLEPLVDRLVELAGGGRVLELAVGTGRVAIPLVEHGLEVVGIELSTAMIDVLRSKIDEQRLPVIAGDMSTAEAPGSYALVVLVFNTIGNLLTQDTQVACFANAARHLEPGGRFVIELMVPELRRLPPGPAASVFSSEPGYLGIDTYDLLNQQLVSHHVRFGEGREAQIFRTPQRYAWPSELDLMGRLAGFTLESRHANWIGSPFTGESTSHVSVYRRPD